MKKSITIIASILFLAACNNNSTTTTSKDSTGPSTTNVPNVNGNIPDTTSGMTLNQSLPVDSSRVKDSSKH